MQITIPFQGGLTSKILNDLISENEMTAGKMRAAYERYKGKAPIKDRELANPKKINNKLNNDFFSDIIDTKTGYMGNDVTVELMKDRYEGREQEFENHNQIIQEHQNIDHVDDKMSSLIAWAAIAGRGTKLFWYKVTGGQAYPVSTIINPWEIVFVNDGSTDEPQAALRYYYITLVEGDDQTQERIRAEWYDYNSVTYYTQDNKGNFMFDESIERNPREHMYKDIPIINYPNNNFEMGDCDKIFELIDAYDRTLSDVNSEIEQLRLAYMYLKGLGVDDETMEVLKQTGVLQLGPDEEAGFLTKKLDDKIIENHLDRLEKNIMRFGKSVDFGSDAFGGQVPVIAFKIKVAGLEHKAKKTERSFKKALHQEFGLLADAWRKTRFGMTTEIDPNDIKITFTRDIPLGLMEELEMLSKARGHISDKTLYSLMSFIKDPEAEIEALREQEKERGLLIDLDKVST